MLLIDFLRVLYEETPIEIHINYEPVYTGTVENVPDYKFQNSRVNEAYISLDGNTLIISICGQRSIKKK